MDGGFRSYAKRRIEVHSPDLDDYGKPLPPPPVGFYWSRLEDGSWEILEYEKMKSSDDNDFVTFDSSSVIEHVVMPSDTLQGLCLRYGVSAVTLRQVNNFSGSAFRSRKVLRIPIEKGATVRVQDSSHDVLLQKFKNATLESDIEAKYYLEENNWDFEEAMADWSGDESWVKEKRLMQALKESEAQQQQNDYEESEETPLLADAVKKGVQVVQPFEVVYACANTNS